MVHMTFELRIGILLFLHHLTRVAADSHCSNFGPYLQWVSTWSHVCKPELSEGDSFSWFSSCDWVNCNCLWGALEAPVPNDELATCFRQALAVGSMAQDSKLFITALMRTCRGRTDFLSQPCGRCDRYREYRGNCTAILAGAKIRSSQEAAATEAPSTTNSTESANLTNSTSV